MSSWITSVVSFIIAMIGFIASGVAFITSIGGNIYRKESTLALARKFPNSIHGVVLRLYDTLYPENPNFLHLGLAQPTRDVDGLVQWDEIHFHQIRVKFCEKIENYEALVHSRCSMAAWLAGAVIVIGALLSVVMGRIYSNPNIFLYCDRGLFNFRFFCIWPHDESRFGQSSRTVSRH